MKFKIDQKIIEKWPEVKLGIVVALGLDNTVSSVQTSVLLNSQIENSRQEFSGKKLEDQNFVKLWKQVYEDFGSSSKKYFSSIEALLTRVLDGKSLPDINPLVNFYNYASLKYKLPFGGEDLDKVVGDVSLTFATGIEKGKFIGGEKEEVCLPDEVIYKDNIGFICRRWNWREANRTKFTLETQNAVIVAEILSSDYEKDLQEAINETAKFLEENNKAKTQIYYLDINNPEFEIDFISGKESDVTVEEKSADQIKETKTEERKQAASYNKNSIAFSLQKSLYDGVKSAYPDLQISQEEIILEHPAVEAHGDYSTNIAFKIKNQNLKVKSNFLENIDWIVKTINKDNFEDYKEPVPVGKFSSEIKKLIGSKQEIIYLKPRVYAKINGWFAHWVGHKEIDNNYFYLLPILLHNPSRLYKDKRNETVYHFVINLPKNLDVVVDLFYEKTDDYPQVSSIYYIRNDYLKNFEEIVLGGGAAVSPSWPALEETLKNVAGSRLSSLRQNHKVYNTLNPKSQEEILFYEEKLSPQEVAEKIVAKMQETRYKIQIINGFINFWLSEEELITKLKSNFKDNSLAGKKIMVEFAHPNTHKELHIGHMRTLITGEALARILEASGAEVFRANYQGDIGPHVAKALWGIRGMDLSLPEKAHLLGQGYIKGNQEYEKNKGEIDELNRKLYQKDPSVMELYNLTRKWSLDYYDSFYTRFYTKFDKLYFESEMADPGKKNILKNIGKVFTKSDGAIVFEGEKFGLHTRVFITSDGNPTYEGKEMGLAFAQFKDFPFDKCIHVVANEQAGYFQVVIKALEKIDPKFIGREFHLSMGMVQLVGKKISSRTGVLVTVDGLLDDIKKLLEEKFHKDNLEAVTIAAVKYSVLKTAPAMNSVFDLEKSVSLEGDSGPYLQYTYARARSVLRKAGVGVGFSDPGAKTAPLQKEELSILRYLYRFPEVVEQAAKQYAPNMICNYLFELAKRFNNFYNNCPILGNHFRLTLTASCADILKNGLNLLGIEALEKM